MNLYENIGPGDKPKNKPGIKSVFFQPKLKANTPNDAREREANAIAANVSGLKEVDVSETVQRKENGDDKNQSSSELDDYNNTLNTSGKPMPDAEKKFFEPKFGRDFSSVKLHTDSVAAKSAQSINALAYTSGNNIVFNTGQYAPESESGKKLIAHELTHVVQQSGGSKSIQRAGWTNSKTTNTKATNIDDKGIENKTDPKSTILRIPIEGLTQGNQKNSMTREVVDNPGTPQQKVRNEAVGTAETAAGKAIALIPDALDATKPVEVLFHLHGHNEGYREIGSSVRDISLDKIEQQMLASGHSQMIGVLPQGTTKSGWGSNFNSDVYIAEVLGKVVTEKKWENPPSIARVILTAHSGGGNIMEDILKPANAGQLPAGMQELALFEAINGPNELAAVKAWVEAQITKDVNALMPGAAKIDHKAYLAKSMRFRGYYTPKGDYVKRYQELDTHIKNLYTKVDSAHLDSDDAKQIKDNYQVMATAANGHNEIMGKDSHLQDSFTALPPL
jgi:hypothetical protein